jgi:tRNA(His) 5'-end guanylyltransferase
MAISLKDRMDSYSESANTKLLPKVPLIINVNGRSFSKNTSLLDKPYCPKFAECIYSTMIKLCSDIDGTVFAYQHSDEITLAVRNDQNVDTTPWYDNKIQKICSAVSAIATMHFNTCSDAIGLNLLGEPIFITQVYAVPNIAEAINAFVYKQQQNFQTSIQFACFYELLKKYDKPTIKEMLAGLSVDEKVDLLSQECNIDFNEYPISYRRGAACYKIPKVTNGIMKNKWFINSDLPIFTKDQSFVSNIFKHGSDIFRFDEKEML